ncbi:unnamed protein product [Cylicocyclus nassatus]|uniref:Uncharacterized protein n=1 Tax=Cylicocyclus nassatus TaxID=53992 RepID=A0AA36GPF1_CYLNA|nr:unnamed protein product [Cylicocyclus nassatus]
MHIKAELWKSRQRSIDTRQMFFTAILLSLIKDASSFAIGTGVAPIGCGPACAVIVPPPPPQPQWSEWGPWSGCSASCGGGVSHRVRLCKDPCNTCCVGVATESSTCNTQPCCEWSSWSPWSECSVTCGSGGTTYRTRQCNCVEGCAGPSHEQISCAAGIPCPEIHPPMPVLPPPPPPPTPSTICISCYLPTPPCLLCSVYTTGWSRSRLYAKLLK